MEARQGGPVAVVTGVELHPHMLPLPSAARIAARRIDMALRSSVRFIRFLALTGVLWFSASIVSARDIVTLLQKDLTGMDGKESVMLMVEYPPGWSTASHRHNAHVFVYVLEGSIVMQNEGGAPVTLGPGQTFYESPDDIHAVARNASDARPAKFLVFIVKDKGAPILVPVQ